MSAMQKSYICIAYQHYYKEKIAMYLKYFGASNEEAAMKLGSEYFAELKKTVPYGLNSYEVRLSRASDRNIRLQG